MGSGTRQPRVPGERAERGGAAREEREQRASLGPRKIKIGDSSEERSVETFRHLGVSFAPAFHFVARDPIHPTFHGQDWRML